jgi:hypothetical protein
VQKFAELDIRKKALKYRYPVINPTYEPERYKQHYFLDDFDDQYNLFTSKNYAEYMEKKEKGELKQNIGDESDPVHMR